MFSGLHLQMIVKAFQHKVDIYLEKSGDNLHLNIKLWHLIMKINRKVEEHSVK